MMTTYHNSFGRRVAFTLLAVICVFGLWTSPTLADPNEVACHCEVDFTGEPLDICVGETVYFTGTAIGVGLECDISSWAWDFGDGTTGSGQQTQHIYNTAGVYTVTLTAIDATGIIVTTKTDYVTVHPNPTADFSAMPTSGEAPLTVDFTDNSTSVDPILSWEWNFGDGSSTSSDQNPTHVYRTAGYYTVTLYVTTEWCDNSVDKVEYIYVTGQCKVDFDGDRDVCVGNAASFAGFLRGEECDVNYWTWDFGDGSTDIGQNVQHVYNTAGVYTISMTANVDGVDTTVTKIDFVTVHPNPTADFSAMPTSGEAPLTVDFTDNSTSVDPILSWEWNFGDGSSTSSDQNPTHVYRTAGYYTVTLYVTTEWCDNSVDKVEYIYVTGPCEVDFSGDRELCEGETADFEADWWGECNIAALDWDFGDPASGANNTASGQYVDHQYNTAGVYTVTLTANVNGVDTVITKTDYVTVNVGPTAAFDANPMSGDAPLTVHFTDQSTTTAGGIVYRWQFGDGTYSGDPSPSHTYTAAGDYQVILEVEDYCGIDSEIKTIHVEDDCRVGFYGKPLEICAGDTSYFTATFYDHECPVDSWTWDFGDPASGSRNTASGTYVLHRYDVAGLYTVTLTVAFPTHDTVITKTDFITVYANPTADFNATPMLGVAPLSVNFTDASTPANGSIVSWSWNFGDGRSSSNQNPTHTYTAAGDYTVILDVEDEYCTDREVKEVYIHVEDSCRFDLLGEPREICEGETVYLTGIVIGECQVSDWNWDFGDGITGTGQQTQHTYNTAGVYTVTLTATDTYGDHTVVRNDYVTVNAGPTADFSATPLSGLAPLTVSFTDLSTSTMGIGLYTWHFGDGDVSGSQNPTHIYTAAGDYTVILEVQDECGIDSEIKEVYIHVEERCEVDFFGEPLEICEGETVNFTGSSTGDCEIGSWTWDFGDPASGANNIGTGQYPQHTYNTAGVFTVILTATDITGDKVVTKTNYVTVNAGPTADFHATPLSGMAPLTVDFNDLSTSQLGITSWTWDFGDGTALSSVQNPTHTYADTGTFTATLIVENPCGEDTTTTVITVGPAISITKLVDKVVAVAGEELLYTMTVHNAGDLPITSVMVIDTIPDSTAYVNLSVSSGGVYLPNSDVVMWSIPLVGANSSVDVSFRIVLDGPFVQYPTHVYNQALAVIDDGGIATSIRTFYSNIVETVVNPDGPTGELEITKDVSASLVSPGDMLTYTITVRNPGPISPAENVVVYDAIPDSTTYVGGSVTGGGTYRAVDDSLHWNLGTLNAFASRTVTFQVTVDSYVADGSRIPNTAKVLYDMNGLPQGVESREVVTLVSLVPLVVTKTTNRPSGMVGDLVRFTIAIENFSNAVMEDVLLTDTMPAGIFYVDGTSVVDGVASADPSGNNPFEWSLGDLQSGGTFTVQYVGLIGASAHPAINENIARALAYQGVAEVHSNRAVANVYVLGHTLTGSIRGRVIVDCDGDGIADIDSVPSGMDIFLDDGSQSRVNNKGMFYFSTVRPGERVVALDERDLDGYYIPEDAQASVFVHVHETGESYVIFRICPEYPQLDISKKAAIVPTVMVTKVATFNAEQPVDSFGVLIDYQIDIASNGLIDPTQVRVVDSLPDNMHLILAETETLAPRQDGNQLIYEVTAAQERLKKSVYYSLRDIAPGVRKFLNNQVCLEGDLARRGDEVRTVSSDPAVVAVGPMLMAPPRDIQITLTPALFKTSYAILRPEAIPELYAVADSIARYPDADILVEGHTDLRPIHTAEFPSNWELGEARAKVVVDWLMENRGVDGDRLKYESFAATRPVVVDVARTSPALQPNRRTEVIIKTDAKGFFAPAAIPADRWESTTSLALEPVNYDTLFEPAPMPMVVGLDDSWEIVLTVENQSAIAAENTALTDIMPDGVAYVDGSATIDGVMTVATVEGQTLSFNLVGVDPGQVIELRYRVTALPHTIPSGGGAASIEVMTSNNQPVILKSNEIRFQ